MRVAQLDAKRREAERELENVRRGFRRLPPERDDDESAVARWVRDNWGYPRP